MSKKLPILLILLTASCSDSEFLDRRPIGLVTECIYYTPEGALEGLTGIYDILQQQEKIDRFDMLGDILSPDLKYTGEPGGSDSPFQANFERFYIAPNSNGIYDYWKTLFTGIYRCNLLLDVITDGEHLSNFSETLRQRIIGEVYFLRGLIEFKLLIVFAGLPQLQQDFNNELLGLPFYDHVPTPDEYYTERPTLESSWQRVIDDFQEAIQRLPLKSEYNPSDLGRATKGSAQAMLAKTYLYTEHWQEAFDVAETVILSEEYGLVGGDENQGPFFVQRTSKDGIVAVEMPAYKWIFQPEGDNNCEDIFSIQYAADHVNGFPENQEGNLRPDYFGPRYVYVWHESTHSFQPQQLFWGMYQPTILLKQLIKK